MDLLTHVLQEAGLVRRMLDARQLDASHALRFPCDRSLGLHIVTHGTVWLHAPGLTAPTALGAGDVALMARGCVHVLSTSASLRGVPLRSVPDIAGALAEGDVTLSDSRLISGAYQLWNAPLHPLFAQLPPWFILRATDVPPLSPLALSTSLVRAELEQTEPGSQSVLHGLLDVIFTYMLRETLRRHTPAAGVSMMLRDPQVHLAVTLMHDELAFPWTLDSLASHAGLSRTGLAERFRETMGDTPLQYLRTIRVQHAMRLLGETSQSLDQIARSVGYSDAFSFSKVFKRVVGQSPRDFRRRDLEDRALPYRFATMGSPTNGSADYINAG